MLKEAHVFYMHFPHFIQCHHQPIMSQAEDPAHTFDLLDFAVDRAIEMEEKIARDRDLVTDTLRREKVVRWIAWAAEMEQAQINNYALLVIQDLSDTVEEDKMWESLGEPAVLLDEMDGNAHEEPDTDMDSEDSDLLDDLLDKIDSDPVPEPEQSPVSKQVQAAQVLVRKSRPLSYIGE